MESPQLLLPILHFNWVRLGSCIFLVFSFKTDLGTFYGSQNLPLLWYIRFWPAQTLPLRWIIFGFSDTNMWGLVWDLMIHLFESLAQLTAPGLWQSPDVSTRGFVDCGIFSWEEREEKMNAILFLGSEVRWETSHTLLGPLGFGSVWGISSLGLSWRGGWST